MGLQLAGLGLERDAEAAMVDYLVRAAYMMVNAADPEQPGTGAPGPD